YGLHRDLLLGPGRKRARGLLRAAPERVEPAAAVLGTGRQGPIPRALGRSALADPGFPAGVAGGTGSRAGPTLVSGIADLLGAVRRGDAKAVGDRLVAQPELASARDEQGNSPLLIATYFGKHDLVRLLLERGARASFFEACALGLVADVRRQLRENPALVGQRAHDGWPPLRRCARARVRRRSTSP